MFLGSEGWSGPKPLVDALTSAGAARPQLVILQLCEDKDGDASENFERLAPELIAKDVPAVLAMQYACDAEQGGVGPAFYKRLCDGKQIGEAVQESRHLLFTGHNLNRRFGTPVLYLQGDGPLVLIDKPPKPAGGVEQPQPQAAHLNSHTIRNSLSAVIDDPRVAPLLGKEAVNDLLRWIIALDPKDDLSTARTAVKHQLTEHISPAKRAAYGVMLENLAKLEKRVSDAQARTA